MFDGTFSNTETLSVTSELSDAMFNSKSDDMTATLLPILAEH